jgi:hypothetical protein
MSTRSALRPAVLAALIIAVTVGCAGPRGGATASDAAGCAAVLPLARDAVHARGTLILVRKVNADDIDAITREAGVVPPAPAPRPARPPSGHDPAPRSPLPRTCLVVYQGDYPAGTVAPAAGSYAVIILRVRHPAIDRVLVTTRLPPSTAGHRWWHIFR